MGKDHGAAMIFRILILVFFACTTLQAQVESRLAGLPGAPFRLGFGAPGMSFGNAAASALKFSQTAYYNPALVPFQQRASADLSAGFLSLDRHIAFLTYGSPIRPSGGFAISVITAGVSDIEQRDSDGQPTGTTSTSENSFLLSFGVKVSPRVAVGISTKILYYKLFTDIHSTTVGFDFGLLYLLSDEFSVAVVLQDVGSNYKWDTTKLYGLSGNTTRDFFPVRRKLGVSYSPTSLPIVAAAELENLGGVTLLRSGGSVGILPEFLIQAGIDQIDLSEAIPAKPAIGFTVQTLIADWPTRLHYAFMVEPYSPSGLHVVSLGVVFK